MTANTGRWRRMTTSTANLFVGSLVIGNVERARQAVEAGVSDHHLPGRGQRVSYAIIARDLLLLRPCNARIY